MQNTGKYVMPTYNLSLSHKCIILTQELISYNFEGFKIGLIYI